MPKRLLRIGSAHVASHRWTYAALVIITEALVIVIFTVLFTQAQRANARQDAELKAAQAKIAAAEDAKRQADFVRCDAAIEGTATGNKILAEVKGLVGDVQGMAIDISKLTTNPDVAASLKARAARLERRKNRIPHFTKPTCTPTPKKGATP